MVPWIQVYSNILTHDKTYALAEKLRVPNYTAVGIMVSLWSWAAVNAPDGDITGYPPRAIADAVGWRKGAEALANALLETRLIADEDGRRVIRHWERYAALLMEAVERQRESTRQRVQKYRSKAKEKAAGNVTETPCNAPTVPDQNRVKTAAPFGRSSPDGPGGERGPEERHFTPSGSTGEGEKLRAVGGELGRGVVLMSEEQFDDLLEKLTLDEFNTYVGKLAHLIADKGYRYSRSHYQAVLEMVERDRKAGCHDKHAQ